MMMTTNTDAAADTGSATWDGPPTATLAHHPITLLKGWPLPTSEPEVAAFMDGHPQLEREYDAPPHPDELTDRYVQTVVETDCWEVFRLSLYGCGFRVYAWNRYGDYGFAIHTVEDDLDALKALFGAWLAADDEEWRQDATACESSHATWRADGANYCPECGVGL